MTPPKKADERGKGGVREKMSTNMGNSKKWEEPSWCSSKRASKEEERGCYGLDAEVQAGFGRKGRGIKEQRNRRLRCDRGGRKKKQKLPEVLERVMIGSVGGERRKKGPGITTSKEGGESKSISVREV